MKTCRIIASSAVAALCLVWSAGGQVVDDAEYLDENEYSEAKTTESQPAKYNKASGLIGMDVRNHKNEKLGQIKDLVFDLKSERVAYAVLSTDLADLNYFEFFTLNEKLIAVPLSAFTAGADHNYLILNAEMDKLASATGFSYDKWPSVEVPSWGSEPFWMKDVSKPDLRSDPDKDSNDPDNDSSDPDNDTTDPDTDD